RTVSFCLHNLDGAMILKGQLTSGICLSSFAAYLDGFAADKVERLLRRQIAALEFLHNLLRRHFPLSLGDLLNLISKLFVHALRQLESIEGIHYVCYAALPGLAVDP